VIKVSCEACGWVAITSQPVNDVWREHEAGCPAVGGAVRHLPDLPPLRRLQPSVNLCRHRPVQRQIAVTPAGVKKYAVMCELCGRLVGRPWRAQFESAVVALSRFPSASFVWSIMKASESATSGSSR
jgi:hypothetical protein